MVLDEETHGAVCRNFNGRSFSDEEFGYYAFDVWSKLREFRKDGDFCDVELICRDGVLHAHKCIISTASPYFKTVFTSPLAARKGQQTINLENYALRTVAVVLDYIYDYSSFKIDDSVDVEELLVLAEFIQLDMLVKELIKSIRGTLNATNCFEWLRIGKSSGVKIVYILARHYIVRNMDTIDAGVEESDSLQEILDTTKDQVFKKEILLATSIIDNTYGREIEVIHFSPPIPNNCYDNDYCNSFDAGYGELYTYFFVHDEQLFAVSVKNHDYMGYIGKNSPSLPKDTQLYLSIYNQFECNFNDHKIRLSRILNGGPSNSTNAFRRISSVHYDGDGYLYLVLSEWSDFSEDIYKVFQLDIENNMVISLNWLELSPKSNDIALVDISNHGVVLVDGLNEIYLVEQFDFESSGDSSNHTALPLNVSVESDRRSSKRLKPDTEDFCGGKDWSAWSVGGEIWLLGAFEDPLNLEVYSLDLDERSWKKKFCINVPNLMTVHYAFRCEAKSYIFIRVASEEWSSCNEIHCLDTENKSMSKVTSVYHEVINDELAETVMENFVLYDEIGAGNDRTVYKGRRKGTIEYVSIHCIGKTKRKHIQNNVRICHELNHNNVVRFHEWYETSNHLWLVVELCTGPSLETILVQDLVLPETTIRSFGQHLIHGLVYLHSLDIVYVDLCPKKILLDGDGTLKYSNFSLAKFEGEGDYSQHFHNNITNGKTSAGGGAMGAPLYMAPEVLSGNGATKESDLWQLGCVIYEMFTGFPPFKSERFEDLCERIVEAKYEYPMQDMNDETTKSSNDLFSLIEGLLRVDPSQRLTLAELSVHPFWNGELDDLAVSLGGNVRDASILCDSFSYTNKVNDTLNEVSIVDSLQEVVRLNGNKRPDTVPQQNESKTLQTKSLTDERPALMNRQNHNIVDEVVKEKWKGTYKLEQGLAIMDLTEIGAVDDQVIEDDQTVYSKTRESKSPFGQHKSEMNSSMNSTNMGPPSELTWNLNGSEITVSDYLYHASDLHVNPISENPKLLKLHVLKWDPTLLGFHALNMEKLRNSTKEEVQTHVATVFNAYAQVQKSTQDKNGTRQKMHILAYLCGIAKHEEVSNGILEQNHVKHFINEFKTGQPDIKVRLGRVIGIVASNTTYIPLSFNMSELFTVLTDQLKQNFRNTVLKHSLLPAVGELLFFAATQEENEKTEIEQWEPSSAVFTIITRCLQQEEDHVARHIAAKIIENIIVTQGRYCKKFLTNEVGLGLWNLFIHAASDTEKITAASTLCRMSMHASTVLQHVSDRAGFNTFQQCVVSGPQKCQQSFVTIFVCLLSSNNHAKRILQETSLIKKLMHNLESASFILRGKMYLLVAEMCKRSHSVLLQCCELRLIAHLEKDGRRLLVGGKENKEILHYLQQCLSVLLKCIIHLLSPIFDSVLHILDVVTGRHHPNVAQTKQLKLLLPLLSVPVHLVTSSLFRKTIVDSKFVQYVGKLLLQIRRIDSGEINLTGAPALSEQATSNIFSIIEAMTQIPSILFQHFYDIVSTVLPVLASFSESGNGNLRILSMKLFVDISTLFLDNESAESTSSQERDSQALLAVIEEHFLPDFETLLQDHDPLPSYCLKLLYSSTEKFPKIIERLVEQDILSTLITMIQTNSEDENNTVLLSTVGHSTVGILNNIVSCKQINFINIYQPILIDYLTSTFIEVMEVINVDLNVNSLSSVLLPLLDTLHHVLKNIEALVKAVSTHEMGTDAEKDELKKQVEEMHRECEVLSDLDGTLMHLLTFDDSDIQEWTCRCLQISAELFGGGTYIDGFSEDNIDSLCRALRDSPSKRQKVLLKIIRTFITSNSSLEDIFRNSSSSLLSTLEQLTSSSSTDADGKNVKNFALELLKLLK